MEIRNLITGGSGFLGTNLTQALLKKNEKVYCLDNFCTGNEKNIRKYLGNKNFVLIKHDVINPISINVDRIWHLACPASPSYYQSHPIKVARTNFIGTYNMLQLAKKVHAKILLASSSEIYGDPEEHPQHETYNGSVNNIGKRSCYEEGKRIAESLCKDFNRMHNLEVRIMRIFNTYGPYMDSNDGRVTANFINQALMNKNLTIYGDGSQTRSFCYVDDLIKGMILLMNSNYNKPINIGNPKEISIKELAIIIKNLINKDLEFEYMNLPDDDPKKRKPSIKIAKKELNWEPQIPLNKGLQMTINWFKNNI